MIKSTRSDSLIEVNERRGFNPIEVAGVIWYTDGYKTKKGHWNWGVLPRDKEKLSFSLGQYTTVGPIKGRSILH
jgi:hypothetical protein